MEGSSNDEILQVCLRMQEDLKSMEAYITKLQSLPSGWRPAATEKKAAKPAKSVTPAVLPTALPTTHNVTTCVRDYRKWEAVYGKLERNGWCASDGPKLSALVHWLLERGYSAMDIATAVGCYRTQVQAIGEDRG